MLKEYLILVGLTVFDWLCKFSREINFKAKKIAPRLIPDATSAYFYGNSNVTDSVRIYMSMDHNPTCDGLYTWLSSVYGKVPILTIVRQSTFMCNDAGIKSYAYKTLVGVTCINLVTKQYIKKDYTTSPIIFGRISDHNININSENLIDIDTDESGNIISNHKNIVEPNDKPVVNSVDKLDDIDEFDDIDELDELAKQLH